MYLLPLFPFPLFVPYRISPQSQSIALSCVCRRGIKGQPGSSWPQRMTIVSCVMPPSVHWQLHRPIIKARITPRNCGSLRPSRTPTTCRFNQRKVLHFKAALASIIYIYLSFLTSENVVTVRTAEESVFE